MMSDLPKITQEMIKVLDGTGLIETTAQGAFGWTKKAVDLIPFLSSTEQQEIESLRQQVKILSDERSEIMKDTNPLLYNEIESLRAKLKDAQSLYREYQIKTSKQEKEIESLRAEHIEILQETVINWY